MMHWWCIDDAGDYVGANDDTNDGQWWCSWQEPPKWVDSLRLYFYKFEKSQLKHNILDCHNIFGIFFINCKVYMLKDCHKSKLFFHFQNI
jgi:hypothetical protein